MPEQTLLVVLAHPDDEVVATGAIRAQRERGDRVVVLWLTRGEMTQAFGSISTEEVARKREAMADGAARILDAETRFLDLPDTGVRPTREAAVRVARIVAEVRPDGLLTWGDGWVRGFRHPDHQATGKIARDAVNLARIAKVVEPAEPHRERCTVFTYRGVHSRLPAVAIDVEDHRDTIFELAAFYRERIGFGDPEWLEGRLRDAGRRWSVRYAEEFDAWESGSGLVEHLLPPLEGGGRFHPDRERGPDPG